MKKYYLIITLATLFITIFVTNSVYANDNNQSKSHNKNIELGIPFDKDTSDDFIIIKNQYVVSYNPKFNSVNWAAWNLNSSWIGKSGRYSGKFITDTTLPNSFIRITHDDYTNSGYDRGHLVRSHDRSNNEDDNKSTFLMTNIIAQTPDLNRGVWLDFERFCQTLAEKDNKELYIYAGAIYKDTLIFGRKIRVPDSCYKIVVVLNKGEGIECIDYNTKIYSVIMPNNFGIRNHKWQLYSTSVIRIEQSSGYNFLPNVSENIQGIIEQIVNK